MKHQVSLLLVLFFMYAGASASDGRELLLHPASTLKLKACDGPTDCSFYGSQLISGTYEIGDFDTGENPECLSTEKKRCISLRLYPNEWQTLPHFDGSTPDYILVTNSLEAATAIVGKRVLNQIIRNKIPGVSGRVTVVLSNFEMGLSCDSTGYANAKIKRVTKKSRSRIKEINNSGC